MAPDNGLGQAGGELREVSDQGQDGLRRGTPEVEQVDGQRRDRAQLDGSDGGESDLPIAKGGGGCTSRVYSAAITHG